MTAANLGLFALAVALLWLPRGWLRRGPVVLRSRRRRHDAGVVRTPQDGTSLSFRREFAKVRNYCDLLRAAAGSVALIGGFGIDPALRLQGGTAGRATLVELCILAIGVVVQTVRYQRGRVTLTAPVFYVTGLAVALCTPWAALSGFVLAWALSPVVPGVSAFLAVQAVITAACGVLLEGLTAYSVAGPLLCILPVLLSLLTRQRLLVLSRRSVDSTRSAAA